ncbi:MAG: metallophosphoesterase family protein [Anaerolineales bacterium]|nr:metallophosphoesterase family protein [Anaerolineales bacterium]
MKIAIIADLHANWIALQTIVEHLDAWNPDQVIVAGDVINRGPRPAECLQLILERQHTQGWRLVRGNHEDYVIHQAQPETSHSGSAAEVHRASNWTLQKLRGNVAVLEEMPFQQSMLGPDGREVRFVHASMLGNRIGIYPENSDEELIEKMDLHSPERRDRRLAVFCVGHTHRPLIRQIHGILVVNAGSAGLPFDEDTRPCYARLTWANGTWSAEIIRLRYDLAAADHDFYDSGYLPEAGPLVKLVQIELRTARSQLYHWAIRYQDRAMAGEISMEESVNRYLAGC